MVYLGLAETDDEYISDDTPAPGTPPDSTGGSTLARERERQHLRGTPFPEQQGPGDPRSSGHQFPRGRERIAHHHHRASRSYNDAKSIGRRSGTGPP
ncbi:hypothetical protein QJS66_05475 [Kocuria rhizophila]|nr:hypothetical protein QJS66_05475 [Kocuria rhizophila]